MDDKRYDFSLLYLVLNRMLIQKHRNGLSGLQPFSSICQVQYRHIHTHIHSYGGFGILYVLDCERKPPQHWVQHTHTSQIMRFRLTSFFQLGDSSSHVKKKPYFSFQFQQFIFMLVKFVSISVLCVGVVYMTINGLCMTYARIHVEFHGHLHSQQRW